MHAREPLTVAQAARLLEVPEARVRRFIAAGRMRFVRVGRNNAKLYDRDDVEAIGRSLGLGLIGKHARQVVVHEDLTGVVMALRIGGLHVVEASSALQALGEHEQPILFWPITMPEQEAGLLAAFCRRVKITLIGSGEIDERLERDVHVAAGDELRRIVQIAWDYVEARSAQV